jgi:hypothetical protein
MDAKTLFYIGIILGFLAGIILTLVVVRVKSLFVSGEVRRLRQENKTLDKRIQEKDKYINQMMGHAEELARGFNMQRQNEKNH